MRPLVLILELGSQWLGVSFLVTDFKKFTISFYQLLTILALNRKEQREFPCVEQLDREGASWVRTYTHLPNSPSTGKLHDDAKLDF